MPKNTIAEKQAELDALTLAIQKLTIDSQNLRDEITNLQREQTNADRANTRHNFKVGQQVIITSDTGGLKGRQATITQILPKSVELQLIINNESRKIRRLQQSVRIIHHDNER